MPRRGRPSIGVVIPCRDNAWSLAGVLQCLRAQSSVPEAVVVVDDNSDEYEADRIRRLCYRRGVRLRRLPPARDARDLLGRRSHARNAGSRMLATDVVLYLDGDMLLGRRYIETIRGYHAALPRCYLRAVRRAIPEQTQRRGMAACLGLATRELATLAVDPCYTMAPGAPAARPRLDRAARVDRWEWCAANNLSVRREHVARIGYWDEAFFGWGEEDLDFSYRLHRAGITPLLVAGTAAYHLDHPVDLRANLSTLKDNASYFVRKFPEIADRRRAAYARYGIDVDTLR